MPGKWTGIQQGSRKLFHRHSQPMSEEIQQIRAETGKISVWGVVMWKKNKDTSEESYIKSVFS